MATEPQIFDLALAVSWEYDDDFIDLVEQVVQDSGMRTYLIRSFNVSETLERLRKKKLAFRVLLDRASDEDPTFQPIAQWASHARPNGERRVRIINTYRHLAGAADKATMHLELIAHGLHTPYTIIISPYNHKRELELSLTELANLGRPFVIKPANTTGGGIGVVTGAESLKDIISARQHHKNDKYLLQRFITPVILGHRRAWFRVFFAFGETYICWWDDLSHLYDEVSSDDEGRFGLQRLHDIGRMIFEITKLEFFSSEVALTEDGTAVIVDYVNEICDMRLKSRHPDGVPDPVAYQITCALKRFLENPRILDTI
jgi:hypothetical protein